MSFASLVLPCLALRSTDTIETLVKTQQRYESISTEAPELANVIHTCVNLQKKNTGLSGLMYEIQGDSLLNCTDMLTEEVFKGISVVKCNINEMQAISLIQQKDELTLKLNDFLSTMQTTRKNKAGMLLDQILPSADGQDFWWYGQTCELKGGASIRESILHDGKRGDVIFYNAFSCIDRSRASLTGVEAGADLSFKDACIWDPILHGSIGLYTQRAGDGNNVFLVCVSDFDQIASDIVRSMKADLGNTTNTYDFCDSKEMWFIQKIAQRNRLRLILQTAQHLEICVPYTTDLYAHPKQDKPDLAIECCGVNLDHIECTLEQDSLTHRSTPLVRHYKDCINIYGQNGPVPVLLGDTMGFMLLLPDKFSHASFSNYNDTPPFVQNRTGQHIQLCPTYNIFEQNYTSVQKIYTEQQNIVHVTIHDFLYDMQQQGVNILPHVRDLLTMTDEYANFIFYGVQHGIGAPTVLYPRMSPSFSPAHKDTLQLSTNTNTDIQEYTQKKPTLITPHSSNGENCSKDNHDDAKNKPLLVQRTTHGITSYKHKDLCQAICEDFIYKVPEGSELPRLFDFQVHIGASNPDRMQLEWSNLTINLVQNMTRMQHIDTLHLLPHATFSNYIEH